MKYYVILSSSLLSHLMFLSTLLLNALNLCSSFRMTGQVSQPYKVTGKIKVLSILIYLPKMVNNLLQVELHLVKCCYIHWQDQDVLMCKILPCSYKRMGFTF